MLVIKTRLSHQVAAFQRKEILMKISKQSIIRIYFIILATALILFDAVLGVLLRLGLVSINTELASIIIAVTITFLIVLSPVALINEIKDSRQAQ